MGLLIGMSWRGLRISDRLQRIYELVIEADAAPPGTHNLERATVVHVPHHLHEHRRHHVGVHDGPLLQVVFVL